MIEKWKVGDKEYGSYDGGRIKPHDPTTAADIKAWIASGNTATLTPNPSDNNSLESKTEDVYESELGLAKDVARETEQRTLICDYLGITSTSPPAESGYMQQFIQERNEILDASKGIPKKHSPETVKYVAGMVEDGENLNEYYKANPEEEPEWRKIVRGDTE